MTFLFAVLMTVLSALVSADVSHLSSYNYPAPLPTNFAHLTPKQTFGPSYAHAQIESIKPSISLGGFHIHQQMGSQGFAGVQSSGSYNNNNAPQHHHFAAPVQQQSFTGPSAVPIQQSFSTPAVGPSPRSYLPPAVQPVHSATPVQAHSAVGLAAVQQSFPVSDVGTVPPNTFETPGSAHIHQQLNSVQAVAPGVHYSPAVMQQQNHLAVGQIQEQSFDFSGHQQQQSYGGLDSGSLSGSGAYNYQAPVQQQNFPVSVPTPIKQSYPISAVAPVQQTYSVPANVQQQSYSTSTNAESGSYNFQPPASEQLSHSTPSAAPVQQSFAAPVSGEIHQTVTASVGVESGSYNYQPQVQRQQQYTGAVRQTQSVPAATPVQLVGSTGGDTSSIGHQLTASQGVDSLGPASTPHSLSTPVTELKAPAPIAEVGTVYGENGGYVYRKF